MSNQPETNIKTGKKVAISFNYDQIDHLEIFLLDAPAPPRNLTQSEVLIKLAPTLKSMIEKGHNKESIALLLADQGMLVSPRAIARALSTPRAKRVQKK